jgi:undecaprenyl-diphosphatase
MELKMWQTLGWLMLPAMAWGAGGPLGIDHRLGYSDRGIWQRNYQVDLEDGVILLELAGSLTTLDDSRVGLTFRKSVDSSVFTALSVEALKYTLQRARPNQGDNPDLWFKGGGYQSFPSGEVALQASFVTPFIVEYHADHPWVWALEALPAFDAMARMKAWAHWQTDVLAGWAIGSGWGIYSQGRSSPLVFGLLPHGFTLAYRTQW